MELLQKFQPLSSPKDLTFIHIYIHWESQYFLKS